MLFYRLKPRIIYAEGVIEADLQLLDIKSAEKYEQIKIVDCPKRPEKFGNCPGWNNGKGNELCCSCTYAKWETV